MANNIADSGDRPGRTLQIAWWSYLAMLFLPFPLLAFVLFSLRHSAAPLGSHGVAAWFIATMTFVAVVPAAALFYRRHLFKAYQRGEVVKPRLYLIGMLTSWVALDAGIIFSIVGCLVTRSILPGLLPAVVAFMFIITLWPTGEVMIGHAGASDDAQIYEEPR